MSPELLGLSEARRPWLRSVDHGQDLDDALAHPVGDNVGRARNDQLARANDAARASHEGMLGQSSDGFGNADGQALCRGGTVRGNVACDAA